LRLFEGREIAPGVGCSLEINLLGLWGGVTIYGHGGVPGYLTGMLYYIRGTERQLVTSFIIFSGERPGPDYGADLSLVLRPAHYN
jgi:hypothetical protein